MNFKKFLGVNLIGATLLFSNPVYSEEGRKHFIPNLETLFPKPKVNEEEKKHFITNLEFYVSEGDLKEKEKIDVGNKLVGLLKNECDMVAFYLMQRGRNKDLVVRCYKGEPGNYWPAWSINIDNVCRAYVYQKKHSFRSNENFVITELSDASANRKKMKKESAMAIVEILEKYLKKYNANTCYDWKNFVLKNGL